MTTIRFCEQCGARMESLLREGKQRPVCVQCAYVRYSQLIVGAGALVETDGSLLLIRRARPPFPNSWCLPASHVEEDEQPASAAVREETGLEVEILDLVDAYFFNDHPQGCGIFLVYRCEVVGGLL